MRLLAVALGATLSGLSGAIRSQGAAAPFPPGDTNVLTIEDAVRLALANNPVLRAGRARVDAAAGRAAQAHAWVNPELSVQVEDLPVSSGNFTDSKNTVGLSQTVPYPGKKRLDGEIGVRGVWQTEAEWGVGRLEVVRDAKSAFCRVLAAERAVGVARELVQVAESSATAARKRVEAGAAADQEQLRAEIQLEQARLELAGFDRALATSRQELSTLLGRPEMRETPLSGSLAETPDGRLLDRQPELWLRTHPLMAAAQASVERAELELKRARLEPYPDVTLGVSGGREGPADTAIVEFRATLPLPVLDRSKGRKREAAANVESARADFEALEQRLVRDWAIVRKRFRTAADQVTAYRDRILPRAIDALRLVQIGFEQGKFGFIDLLDTQRTAAEARLAYQQKLLDLNLIQAELESLVLPVSVAALQGPP